MKKNKRNYLKTMATMAMATLLVPQITNAQASTDIRLYGPISGPDGTIYELYQFGSGSKDWAEAYNNAQYQTLNVNGVNEQGKLATVTTAALSSDVSIWLNAAWNIWQISWVDDYVDNSGKLFTGTLGAGTAVGDTSWIRWWYLTPPTGGGIEGTAIGAPGYEGGDWFAGSELSGINQYLVAFAPANVPEPGTLSMLAVGGFAGLRLLRRRKQ